MSARIWSDKFEFYSIGRKTTSNLFITKLGVASHKNLKKNIFNARKNNKIKIKKIQLKLSLN